ncbi:MAG: hypothetical protein ACO3YX_06320 [Candidatus Nanopelagicaceae bacterium]
MSVYWRVSYVGKDGYDYEHTENDNGDTLEDSVMAKDHANWLIDTGEATQAFVEKVKTTIEVWVLEEIVA